jgi:hypothetical protein
MLVLERASESIEDRAKDILWKGNLRVGDKK